MPESARLVAVAAHGLAGSRTDLPSAPLSEAEWFDLVQGCVAADLVGFLAAAAADGHLPVSDGQADELAVLESERAGLSLLVERRAITMASLLGAAAIDHRVVDGPARRLAYGDRAVRQFRAVQVLVPPSRFDDARALQGPAPTTAAGRPVQRRERLALRSAIAGLGQVEAEPRPARGADRSDRLDRSDRSDRSDRLEGAVAEVDEFDLLHHLGPPAVIELADRRVSVLTLEQQLVVACVEMVAAPVSSLVQLRDVAQIALSADLDTSRARRLAEATQAVDALADGLALAWSRFDLADKTELSVWALRRSGSRPDRSSIRRSAPPLGARGGLAQRVFGRLQPVPAGSTATSTLSTTAPLSGSGRSSRSTRR
jgi:hypothetical protein